MAAAAKPCPDPSAHRDTKLQNQASTAALLAASASKNKLAADDILDKDKKLSSRSAAMSLKHAQPEDLPSFPSSGGLTSSNSSGAALLAHGNQKPFEHWKPDPSADAGKAALLAKDYKPAPLWQPGLSAAGSKAALLAHKDAGKHEAWSPKATAEGSSAATQAFKAKPSPTSPAERAAKDKDSRGALLAATASVRRARSESHPAPKSPGYPDSANATHNALNAATKANLHQSGKNQDDYEFSSPALEESRIKHLSDKISRDMFTEHPPVDIEVEEKRHSDALRASSISMAKAMYDLSQRNDKEADYAPRAGTTAASRAVNRKSTGSQPDLRQQAMQYIHLQEAARKLAEERLAKLDPDGATRFRAHYGYPLKTTNRKLSIRNPYRRRAQSVTEGQLSDSSDDEFTSRRIRRQMTQFSKDIEAVDEKKRQTDRAALLAAAEKKVQAQMHSMDERVYAETGKVSPAMMEQWEAKAREKAARDSAKRTENYGKADLGGGKFMAQSEIEAIAAARLKPTLDEINENAEKRRARDEEIRLDQELKKREQLKEKENEKEVKALQKQIKHDEKAAAKQEKAEQKAAQKREKEQQKHEKELQKSAAKADRDAEKARKAEEKHAADEDKQRTTEARKDAAAIASTSAADHEKDEADQEERPEERPERTAAIALVSESVETLEEPAEPEAEPKERLPFIRSRSAAGDPIFCANIERHISHIDHSDDSEDERHASRDGHHNAEAEGKSSLEDKKHIGTDGEIGKTAEAALQQNDKSEETTEAKSPTSKSGFGRLMDRFKRHSRHEDGSEKHHQGTISKLHRRSHAAEKEAKTDDADAGSSKAKSSVEEPNTSSSAAALSAAEAKAVADKHAEAARASPSSFVRGRGGASGAGAGKASSVSDLSSLTSDDDENTGADELADLGLVPGTGVAANLAALHTRGARVASLDSTASRSPARETRFQEQL